MSKITSPPTGQVRVTSTVSARPREIAKPAPPPPPDMNLPPAQKTIAARTTLPAAKVEATPPPPGAFHAGPTSTMALDGWIEDNITKPLAKFGAAIDQVWSNGKDPKQMSQVLEQFKEQFSALKEGLAETLAWLEKDGVKPDEADRYAAAKSAMAAVDKALADGPMAMAKVPFAALSSLLQSVSDMQSGLINELK